VIPYKLPSTPGENWKYVQGKSVALKYKICDLSLGFFNAVIQSEQKRSKLFKIFRNDLPLEGKLEEIVVACGRSDITSWLPLGAQLLKWQYNVSYHARYKKKERVLLPVV
jgi:hypothetical protein